MAGQDQYDPPNGAPPLSGPYPSPGPGHPTPGPTYPAPGANYPAPGAHYSAPGAAIPSFHPGRPGAQPPPHWSSAPVRAAHKPGAVPLRPLRLGDILDAAIRIIRFNPGATVGAAVLFAAVPLLIPILLTGALLPSFDVTAQEFGSQQVALLVSLAVAWVLGLLLQWIGVTLVTGMTAQVAYAAALGQKMSLGQAWEATRGARARLLGLATLFLALMMAATLVYTIASVGVVMTGNVWGIVGWFFLTLPSLAVLSVWFWVKYYLFAVPVLMVERTGVFESLARGSRLIAGHFWRVLGISFLTVLIAQFAAGIVSVPLAILGELPRLMGAGEAMVMLTLVASQAITQILATALVTPFLSAVTALLYIDVRIRKEAFDVELLTQSEGGTTPS